MTRLEAALAYTARGWPVFPCKPWPDKSPLTPNGFHDASTDPDQLADWWRRWPDAIIGMPTGLPICLVVLDIDTKRGVDGWATLARLEGTPIPPPVPTVITASGGAHLYFERPEGGLRSTTGARGRGIGPGLDWRGDGGYVILPSPGSGYRWGSFHFGNCTPLPVPTALLPREPVRPPVTRPVRPTHGLPRYAEAALDRACRAIINGPPGEQEMTLNAECYSIGTLAGAGGIPAAFARRALLWAASQVRNHDPRRPWQPRELADKVTRAFDHGLARPREARHG